MLKIRKSQSLKTREKGKAINMEMRQNTHSLTLLSWNEHSYFLADGKIRSLLKILNTSDKMSTHLQCKVSYLHHSHQHNRGPHRKDIESRYSFHPRDIGTARKDGRHLMREMRSDKLINFTLSSWGLSSFNEFSHTNPHRLFSH